MRGAFALSASLCASLCLPGAASGGEASVTGQTGLISMPDARLAPEGTWRTGLSFARPYQAIWSGISVLPWFEGSFRFTRFYHVPGFSDPQYGGNYGDYKDKSFDVKALILPERRAWPALALGVQDIAGGTGLFRAPYAVASKSFGDLDVTLGYGGQRIDGLFGGVRWRAGRNWSLVAEYDAFDYKQDKGAELSGAAAYRKEIALGAEYRHDWYGAQVFSAHGNLGFNVYMSIPLEQREFVPKVNEPAPYTRIEPRPSEAQWRADERHRGRLARALAAQDFRDIRIAYRNGRLEASLTNTRISSMPRAVGRAARTLLSFAPLEAVEIRVTYQNGTLPVATYDFISLPLLQRYFNGMASREQLAPYVAIEYARPAGAHEERERDETLAAMVQRDRDETLVAAREPLPEGLVIVRESADVVALRADNVFGGRLLLRPAFYAFLNDPSGAFKYDIALVGSYDRAFDRQTFLLAETRLSVYENVSDVTQPSNSTLPHVRSDIAEYRRGGRFKLTRLLVNRFYHPGERVYARASAGIYEELFSGAGGQVLYLPRSGGWGVDVDANWVRQRDFDGGLGHRDYSTFTALASLNYRMARNVTATLRAGRFLAQDEGVRAEIKRRFASGFEVGAWYTVTNGNDITSPGSPSSPYYDKGIFMSMPLDTMLTRDTQATAGFALAPWTRDVGQMVASPGDLYGIVERPLVQMHEHDGLVRFGDRDDDYELPRLGSDRRWPDFVAHDYAAFRRETGRIDWLSTAALAGGMVLASAALDDRALRYAQRHRNSQWLQQVVSVGDALPIAALGLSAVFAFDESRPQLSDTGVAALEAGAVGFVAAEAAKRIVGRGRPDGSGDDSFPSRRTTLMWAAITPYAKEYEMPWLYAAAALTNAAAAGSREHWVSDTVAGAALGYALGHLAWQARTDIRRNRKGPTLAVTPESVSLRWELQ